MSISAIFRQQLHSRLAEPAREWLDSAAQTIQSGTDPVRFGGLISMASRHAKRKPLDLTAEEREQVAALHPGCVLDRWTELEAARVLLILSRPDLDQEAGTEAILQTFQYADEGEACALYRSLIHLPNPERYLWQAGEGCRSNVQNIFEAVALDTEFPYRHFDDVGWRQAVIKCIFIGSPLWRMLGLDERLSEELARMALDLCDERRAAGRRVQPELWLCLSRFGGERALAALEEELDPKNFHRAGRVAAAYGLGRAGAHQQLKDHLAGEQDSVVAEAMRAALASNVGRKRFRQIETLAE